MLSLPDDVMVVKVEGACMSLNREQTNVRNKDETFSSVESKKEKRLSSAQHELLEIIRTRLIKGIPLTAREQEFLNTNYELFEEMNIENTS